MQIRKKVIPVLVCLFVFSTSIANLAISDKTTMKFALKESARILLKDYGKKAGKEFVDSYKEKLSGHVHEKKSALKEKILEKLKKVAKKSED